MVAEPTSSEKLGDTIKIGRRGSVTFELICHGKQGHVAYPDLADNPIYKVISILSKVKILLLIVVINIFSLHIAKLLLSMLEIILAI